MSGRGAAASSPPDTSDPPIWHHYVLVLGVEALVWAALAWLAATYR